jgi:excinuclease ABC subunit C
LRNANVNFIPVFSLSKRNEEIFTSQSSEPIILPNQSLGLQMLQRLRDEAHRFALNYHQKLRKNKTLTSPLDSIPGVGPKRKRNLLKHFGSIRLIRETTEEDLITSGVVNKTIARRIKEYL